MWRTVFGGGDDHLSLVVFDAPMLAGEPLAARPWRERRSALAAALPTTGSAVSLIDVFDADELVHKRLLALGFEGSVLKRRDGRYLAGQRSRTWRKHKTRASSAAVVEVAIADRSSKMVERIGCRVVGRRGLQNPTRCAATAGRDHNCGAPAVHTQSRGPDDYASTRTTTGSAVSRTERMAPAPATRRKACRSAHDASGRQRFRSAPPPSTHRHRH